MARKQHEIQFTLSAHSDGSFSGTFRGAQREIAEFQKELEQINKISGDITAFQKQQAALDNTRKKLEALNAKHDILQNEMKETEAYTVSLKSQMEQAEPDTKAYQELQKELRATEKYYASLQEKTVNQEEQIRRTDTALTGQNQNLDKLGGALKEAGVDTANLAEEQKRLAAESERLKSQQEAVADSSEKMGDGLETALQKAQSMRNAYEVLKPAVGAVMSFLGDSIGTAAGFEESMSNVEALTGATAGEMEQLSDLAKELGASTKFTAKESADAMGYMGMAGWTAQQMISGLPGIMSLAAASGEDLAMVSDIVTDSLSGFGLTANDAGHYADILAATATKANTNVSLMGDTFKYASSLAGTLGVSAEDTAESVGIMANAGIKGGQAGTALRSILSRLATDAGASSTKLGALGVLTERLGVSFYDAGGNVRDFSDVLDDARIAWKGLTAEEQTNYGKTIAGQYALSGWLTLMNATDDEIQKVRTSINNCSGAAEKMAAVKLNNFNGQLTLMNSAWEAVRTTIGEQFLPVGKSAAGVLTDMLTATNDFAREHEDLVRLLTVSTGAFVGLISVLGGVAVAVTALKAAFVALHMSNPIGWIGALAGLAVAAGGAIAAMAHEVDGVRGAEIKIAKSLKESTKDYEKNTTAISAEKDSVIQLSRQLQELSGKSQKTAADQELIADLCGKLNQAVPGLSVAYDKQNDSIIGLNGSLDAYIENLYKAKQRQEDLGRMEDLYGSIQETEKALADANAELEELRNRTKDHLAVKGSLGMTADEADEVNLLGVIARLKKQLESLQGEYDSLKGSINDADDAQKEMADDAGVITDKLSQTAGELDRLRDAYNEAYEAAKKSVEGQFQLWDTAEQDTMNLGDVLKAIQSQIDYWDEYNRNLEKLGERADEIEGLSDVLKGLGDASPKNVSLVAGMANATDGDLKEMVEKIRTLQEEHGKTADSMAEMVTEAGKQMEELSRKTAEEIDKICISSQTITRSVLV